MTLAESADFAQRTSLNKKSFAAVPSGKSGKGKSKDVENGNGNHQQPSADKSFYENLPFHGLKSPPKQVYILLVERSIITFDILSVHPGFEPEIWRPPWLRWRGLQRPLCGRSTGLQGRQQASQRGKEAVNCDPCARYLYFYDVLFFQSVFVVNNLWPYKGKQKLLACGFTIHLYVCDFTWKFSE